MKHLLLVAAGGAIGSSLRHLVNMASLRWFGPNFPWGTLAVNVLGCFAMGVLI
jgi:CrcB protein